MAFDSFRDFVNQLGRAGVAMELEFAELADREMKSPDCAGVSQS